VSTLIKTLKEIFSPSASYPSLFNYPDNLQSQEYEFPADRRALKILNNRVPISEILSPFLAYDSILKVFSLKEGEAKEVTSFQYPKIHKIASTCSKILNISMPTIFVKKDTSLNAYTLGDDDNAIVVLHSALLDCLSDEEISFVLGHEMGHIKSHHVKFVTLIWILHSSLTVIKSLFEKSKFSKYVTPILIASAPLINKWRRCSEITADRAGLICNQNINAASKALLKLECYTQTQINNLKVEDYIRKIKKLEKSPLKILEYLDIHPKIPKRVKALRLFSASDIYITRILNSKARYECLSMDELDREVGVILKVLFKKTPESIMADYNSIRLAIFIAWADGSISEEEKKYIKRLIRISEIEDEQKIELESLIERKEQLKNIGNIKPSEKEAVQALNICYRIARIDGQVNKAEIMAIKRLGIKLGVNKKVIARITRVKKYKIF